MSLHMAWGANRGSRDFCESGKAGWRALCKGSYAAGSIPASRALVSSHHRENKKWQAFTQQVRLFQSRTTIQLSFQNACLCKMQTVLLLRLKVGFFIELNVIPGQTANRLSSFQLAIIAPCSSRWSDERPPDRGSPVLHVRTNCRWRDVLS